MTYITIPSGDWCDFGSPQSPKGPPRAKEADSRLGKFHWLVELFHFSCIVSIDDRILSRATAARWDSNPQSFRCISPLLLVLDNPEHIHVSACACRLPCPSREIAIGLPNADTVESKLEPYTNLRSTPPTSHGYFRGTAGPSVQDYNIRHQKHV